MRIAICGILCFAAAVGTARLAGDAPTRAEKRFTQADYDRHIAAVKRRLPPGDFTLLVQSPFVVIGDEPESRVRRRASDTVKWAVDRLKQEYFAADPSEILDIYLFKDEDSYERNARLLFGET